MIPLWKHPHRHAWVMIVLSGVLSAWAFPSHAIPLFSLLSLLPFLWVLHSTVDPRRCAFYGWLWAVSFFAVVISWIPRVMVEFGHLDWWTAIGVHLLLLSVLGLYFAVFAGVMSIFLRNWGVAGLFFTAPLWACVEWVRSVFPMGGFSWGQLGYAMTPYLGLMQIASITGIAGITFLVVQGNVLVFLRIHWRSLSPVSRAIWCFLAALWLSAWIWGYSCTPIEEREEEAMTVSILQGDIAFENDLENAKKIFRGYYRDETRKALQAGADLVIWPESPTPFSYFDDEEYHRSVQELAISGKGKGYLLFNDIVENRKAPVFSYYNAALLLGPKGEMAGQYRKKKLVPFGEFVPYSDFFRFAEALTREVSGFSAGDSTEPLSLGGRKIGVFICFETIFPDLIRQISSPEVEMLINLSNDSWYGPTSAPWQHLQMAQVRAIENRRPLIRAANSGISALITPRGEIRKQTRLYERTVLSLRLNPRKGISIYNRWGEWFPLLCVMIVACAGILPLWRKTRNRIRKR